VGESDKDKGLYNKFKVYRKDGQDKPGDRHHHCSYFVIDMTHDKFAMPALMAYSKHCHDEYPELSNDLLEWCLNHYSFNCVSCGKPVNLHNDEIALGMCPSCASHETYGIQFDE